MIQNQCHNLSRLFCEKHRFDVFSSLCSTAEWCDMQQARSRSAFRFFVLAFVCECVRGMCSRALWNEHNGNLIHRFSLHRYSTIFLEIRPIFVSLIYINSILLWYIKHVQCAFALWIQTWRFSIKQRHCFDLMNTFSCEFSIVFLIFSFCLLWVCVWFEKCESMDFGINCNIQLSSWAKSRYSTF